MAQDKNELTISSSGMKRFNSIRTGTNIAYSILFILLALLCVIPVVFVVIIPPAIEFGTVCRATAPYFNATTFFSHKYYFV